MQPDLELYYKLKGKLENTLDELPDDSQIKNVAGNHLRKIETKMKLQFDAIIAGAVDDDYYINDMVELKINEPK